MMKQKIKHIPKHMKLPLFKNAHWARKHRERQLLRMGYTIPTNKGE